MQRERERTKINLLNHNDLPHSAECERGRDRESVLPSISLIIVVCHRVLREKERERKRERAQINLLHHNGVAQGAQRERERERERAQIKLLNHSDLPQGVDREGE